MSLTKTKLQYFLVTKIKQKNKLKLNTQLKLKYENEKNLVFVTSF